MCISNNQTVKPVVCEVCMNMKEYWKAVRSGANIREYELKSREIQQSLKYNPDPNATVRHHLMNTPEQIEYNTSHYEMWGS